MKNLETQPNIRYVLGIDPSGNYYEGKGITGWCIYDIKVDKIIKLGDIKASLYDTQEHYWLAHVYLIRDMNKAYRDEGFVVSFENYVLYRNRAENQTNSAMETSQLIGVIKMECFLHGIRYYSRDAVRVMKRWADQILVHKKYISTVNKHYYTDCYNGVLSDHHRDSIRHAVHCGIFEVKEKEL